MPCDWNTEIVCSLIYLHSSLLSFNYFPFANHSFNPLFSFLFLFISKCVSYLSLQFFFRLCKLFHHIYLCDAFFNLMRYASFFILHLKAFFSRSFLSIFSEYVCVCERFQMGTNVIYNVLARDVTACIFNFPYCHCCYIHLLIKRERQKSTKWQKNRYLLFVTIISCSMHWFCA